MYTLPCTRKLLLRVRIAMDTTFLPSTLSSPSVGTQKQKKLSRYLPLKRSSLTSTPSSEKT
ncbi:hypothetical protein [Hydrogenivirga sp. 128-5-R1-1]|uniref:hypothetical protein n=1 Tax=Hydrogenivirga sp. 128-5-R1-1 TaxID=392423 RepID=UPI001E30FD89|nr:hypothetical protein [Hydrogenivirga sp. 128-5-R1-1]